MKIEKINDHQIRCVLSKSELEKRELKLSEIAYGSAKVKKLFRDMMQLAYIQCGFEAENIPLAIEVIPYRDHANIIVTKVENPEELNTRYSRFSPDVDAQGGMMSEFDKFLRSLASGIIDPPREEEDLPFGEDDFDDYIEEMPENNPLPFNIRVSVHLGESVDRFFYFDCPEDLFSLIRMLNKDLSVTSTLYRNPDEPDSSYYLLKVCKGSLSDDAFRDICSVVAQYGSLAPTIETFPNYVNEHYEAVIENTALEDLARLITG